MEDQKYVWWTSPIELWAASSLLRGGGGLRWPTFKPLHHSLLSTALNPRSTLAKEKTSCSQRCTSPSSENWRSGQIEQRPENINLHYPPLVIHFLIAQNLWPRSCYRENLSRGSKICGACTKLADSRHKHRSNYWIAT